MIEFNISSTEVTRFSISGKILSDADILPMRNEIENIVNTFIYHGYDEYCGKYDSDHYPVVVDLLI